MTPSMWCVGILFCFVFFFKRKREGERVVHSYYIRVSSNIIIQLSQKIVSSIQERVRFGTKYSVFTHTHRRRCVPSFPSFRTEIHLLANYAHVQHQREFFVSIFFVCFSKYLYFLRVLLLRTCYSYFVVFHSYSFLRFAFLSVGFMCFIFDFLDLFFFF